MVRAPLTESPGSAILPFRALGKRLRQGRKDSRLTQVQLCELLGIGLPSLPARRKGVILRRAIQVWKEEKAMTENGKARVFKKTTNKKNNHFRNVWDICIKLWTVYITLNLTAMSLVSGFIKEPGTKLPIVIAFIIQNLLSAIVGVLIAEYSKSSSNELKNISQEIIEIDKEEPMTIKEVDDLKSPVPWNFTYYSGYAIFSAGISFVVV